MNYQSKYSEINQKYDLKEEAQKIIPSVNKSSGYPKNIKIYSSNDFDITQYGDLRLCQDIDSVGLIIRQCINFFDPKANPVAAKEGDNSCPN